MRCPVHRAERSAGGSAVTRLWGTPGSARVLQRGSRILGAYRCDTQFFHDETVHSAIANLAAAPSMVIFAGAGLTIDRTGLSWGALIRDTLRHESLSKNRLIDEDGAYTITKHLAPIEAASIATHYYRQVQGSPQQGRKALVSRIQNLLYPGAYWQAGMLTENVVRAAIALSIADRSVHIVTTNYETYIEDFYQTILNERNNRTDVNFPALDVEIVSDHLHRLGRDDARYVIRLTYLHGRVPQQGDPNGELAVSEHDYHSLREVVTERLTQIIGGEPLVIAGSSLTDPPLLAALEATRNGSEPRVAITPIGGYDFKDAPTHEVEALKKHLRARMAEFDVNLYFPDFYYQVPQFFSELIIACVLGDDEPYDGDDTQGQRYGSRLLEWWSAWAEMHLSRAAADRNAHAAARDGFQEVMRPLQTKPGISAKDEILHLEVWVRWDPREDHRQLALWARSDTLNKSFRTPDGRELELDSTVESVRAFVTGRPILGGGELDDDGRATSTFLAVPISYTGGLMPIPVGVVTLSSNFARDKARFNLDDAAEMAKLIEGLKSVGRRLLGVRQTPVG